MYPKLLKGRSHGLKTELERKGYLAGLGGMANTMVTACHKLNGSLTRDD